MKLKRLAPIIVTIGMIAPLKTVQHAPLTPVYDTFEKTCQVDNLTKAFNLAKTLEQQNDTNFVGGITRTFSKENIQRLRETIKTPTTIDDYAAPIENNENIYLEPFGMFFAKRPGGRPHLGLDIFASKYAKKPEKPVVITAPIDGIVISNKKANPNDNVVANCVGLLGKDGKQYFFDHMARPTDYKTSIPMPEVGSILHKGDTIGYVGNTGETALWHLHLGITTEEQLEKQLHSKMWKKVSEYGNYSQLKGQVDPLNENEAGLISKRLNIYKKQNMQSAKDLLLEYPERDTYLTK
ncbi:MAG: M23 family metallopeptidase [Candidatus Gastranaerophilales bacterium]|nr:M23 family metallopeptidase [Candidatus Gastranaerophilales bacterium]